jgi:tetratricopeptide (TPR) repeat protein
MLTLWAYIRYVEAKQEGASSTVPTRKGNPLGFYIAALIFFALGLLSKPMIVTLPCVLLLLDFWPLGRVANLKFEISNPSNFKSQTSTLAQLIVEKVPFFILTAISCAVTFLAQKNAGAMRSLGDFPMTLRMENSLVSYVVYLRRLFWPNDLAIFYPHPTSIPLWQFTGSALFIAAITALVVGQLKKRPYLAVGWFWYFGSLVPAIGLVQVGVQARADRYTYIPYIGLFIGLIWGVCDLAGRLKEPRRIRPVLFGLSAATLIACAILSAWYIQFWQNSKTLFARALQVTTENFIAHHSLGTALANENKNDEAEKHFREAIRLHPRFPEAEQNLGNILLGKTNYDEALLHYKKAVEYRPNFENAWNNLGLLYAREEKWNEAVTNFQTAISMEPRKGATHFNLGSALLKAGRTNEALASYERAVQMDPSIAEAHFQASLILTSRKQMEPAVAHLKQAVALRPEWSDAAGQLAWIWSTHPNPAIRNGAGAVQVAERAVAAANRKDMRLLSVLAAAYAENGRFADAIRTAEEAIQLALSRGQTDHAKAIERKLELYRAGKPYHQD